ncbi:MAG: hypothetical protein HDKAJFGB_02890 [Anaerolineae bacterium]|nr:hypothetical protein [Anaerolineae bacterium]
MRNAPTPRAIFLTRLWAFLNYKTTIGLTWLELLALTFAGLALAWVGLRDWAGIALAGPFALYLVLFGFYRRWRWGVGILRAVYEWLFKPLTLPSEKREAKIYLLVIVAVALVVVLLLGLADWRAGMLGALLCIGGALLFWLVAQRETNGGALNLNTVAGRMPLQALERDGTVVARDGTRVQIALLTLGRTGYKPALAAADVADTLTKFLAYLAQHEDGAVPIKLFWLTDYHLGQLDLSDSDGANRVPPEYLAALQDLAQTGARRARVVLTGIVYPTRVQERVRDWLGALDLGLSPLGAYAAESFFRMLLGGESLLAQIQQATLLDAGALPRVAYRGYIPEQMTFGAQLLARAGAQQNVLQVLRVNTPFHEARDALMRALSAADGLLCVTVTPLPRDTTATELRGQLLAARVPGLGRPRQAKQLRETLEKLEDKRSLEYLFDTETLLVTWGKDDREAQVNQNFAASYLTALNLTPLTDRALDDSMTAWLPLLLERHTAKAALPTRFVNWLTEPPAPPQQRLLTSQALAALAREEGSDIHLADARQRILLGRSVTAGKEGLRYADFRQDTGPVLMVSDQGGGKSSTLIVWFLLRLQLLNYKVIAINLKYSTRMAAALEHIGGVTLHPHDDMARFEKETRAALFSDKAVLYQPVKGTRPYALADDPCLLAFMEIFYEEWLPARNTPAALAIDEIHRLMPKDREISDNAQQVATYVTEAFKDWAERKLVIAAATQTLRDLLGSNLGIALQKFRTVAYFQVGPEDREMLIEKGYEPALIDLIIGARRRPRGYCVLVLPDGFYTTLKVLVTPEEKDIIQRLDVEETSDVTPQLAFR